MCLAHFFFSLALHTPTHLRRSPSYQVPPEQDKMEDPATEKGCLRHYFADPVPCGDGLLLTAVLLMLVVFWTKVKPDNSKKLTKTSPRGTIAPYETLARKAEINPCKCSMRCREMDMQQHPKLCRPESGIQLKPGLFCFSCKEEGHPEKACPNAKRWRTLGRHKQREEGEVAKAAKELTKEIVNQLKAQPQQRPPHQPLLPTPRQILRCRGCNGLGHEVWECPRQYPPLVPAQAYQHRGYPNPTRPGPANSGCHHCGDLSHGVRDCPLRRRVNGHTSTPPPFIHGMICDNCFVEGHKERQCRNPRAPRPLHENFFQGCGVTDVNLRDM